MAELATLKLQVHVPVMEWIQVLSTAPVLKNVSGRTKRLTCQATALLRVCLSDEQCCVIRFSTKLAVQHEKDFSGLIAAWSEGDEQALNELIPLVYPELRRIARQHLWRNPNQTLQSAALANEAYLKLIQSRGIHCESRTHFFALCAMTIRRILVDHARKGRYEKRGGDVVRVPLDEALLGTRGRGVEVLALDDALASLSKVDPRKGHVVELRYFGGLSVEETAEVLGVSPETVLRDWKMAKTWLYRELRNEDGAKTSGESS